MLYHGGVRAYAYVNVLSLECTFLYEEPVSGCRGHLRKQSASVAQETCARVVEVTCFGKWQGWWK